MIVIAGRATGKTTAVEKYPDKIMELSFEIPYSTKALGLQDVSENIYLNKFKNRVKTFSDNGWIVLVDMADEGVIAIEPLADLIITKILYVHGKVKTASKKTFSFYKSDQKLIFLCWEEYLSSIIERYL